MFLVSLSWSSHTLRKRLTGNGSQIIRQDVQRVKIFICERGNSIFNHLNACVMLEKTFGLLFYLKSVRFQKGKFRYIYLRITVDGKVVELRFALILLKFCLN